MLLFTYHTVQEWARQQPTDSELYSWEGIVTGYRAYAWFLCITDAYEVKEGKVRCLSMQ